MKGNNDGVVCVRVCVCVQVSKTVFVYTSDINNENIVISIFHKYCHLCVCARTHERAKGSCATSPCTLCRSDFHQRMFCGGWWIRTVFQECRKVIGKHICVTVPRVHLVGTDRYKCHACSRMCILQILVSTSDMGCCFVCRSLKPHNTTLQPLP